MPHNFAQHLRKSQTNAERYLWYFLRNRQFLKYKFRRQYKIGPFIVDFVCLHQRIIIELDGSQHFEQQAYDEQRTAYLHAQGFKVLRFWNNAVFQNIEGVLDEIYRALLEG